MSDLKKEKPTVSKTLCVYPWMLLSVGANGQLRPCCNATHSTIYKRERQVYKIQEETDYSDFLNTLTHQTIREEMLEGKKPAICDRCWKMEDSGMKSFREITNQRYPELFEKITDSTPFGIYRIEFDLGTKCNLRCRMCAPWSSSLISKEMRTHRESMEYYGNYVDQTQWVDDVDMKEVVSKHLTTLQEIYLIGGEPLIIDAHEELLTYLIESGVSNNIKLIYNTNGIYVGKKFIDMWKKFKYVQLNVSVDGVGKYYEYIRNPAKWNTIENNLKLIMAELQDHKNIACGVTPTLQNLTLSGNSLRDLFLFCQDLNLDLGVIPVNHPDFLQPDVMPEKDYNYYVTQFSEIKDKITRNKHSFDYVMNYLNSNKENVNNFELQQKFVKKQLLLDKVRNQNLFDTHPWAKDIPL